MGDKLFADACVHKGSVHDGSSIYMTGQVPVCFQPRAIPKECYNKYKVASNTNDISLYPDKCQPTGGKQCLIDFQYCEVLCSLSDTITKVGYSPLWVHSGPIIKTKGSSRGPAGGV